MIPLMKNTFLNEYETKKSLANFILKTPRLSMSSKCLEFEKEFGKFQERKESILYNSGASANLAVLQALLNMGKLKKGDHIGFSALTWSTNVMPIIQMGCIPVAIDIEPKTLNVMSYNIVERLKEIKLNAFFATNVLGFTGDLAIIKDICDTNKIILIEDNCEALGTELPTGKSGNFGLCSTFSFFVAHHMSTIEGGMVCTDDEDLAEMLKIVRANGWDRNLNASEQYNIRKRFDIRSEFEAKYTFYDLGYNFRPTEITGFLGLFQLQFLRENINVRENNYLRLENIAKSNPEMITVNREHISKLSNFSFPVICKTKELKEKYFSQFSGAGVEIRPMIAGNIQKQPFYKKYVPKQYALPNTDFIHDCGFYFGNYPELDEFDLETLSNCLKLY